MDTKPYEGRSYYRLRQTDFDGIVSYSWIATVTIHSDMLGLVSLYPNPVVGNQLLVIKYNSSKDGDLGLSLVDITGRIMLQYSIAIKAGENELHLGLPFESDGVYILRLQGPDKTEGIRISRQ